MPSHKVFFGEAYGFLEPKTGKVVTVHLLFLKVETVEVFFNGTLPRLRKEEFHHCDYDLVLFQKTKKNLPTYLLEHTITYPPTNSL